MSADDRTPAPDPTVEPHEDAADGDRELAASEEGVASGSRAHTEEKSSPAPQQEDAALKEEQQEEEQQESKDWLDLPMLAKLDSMHLLTEWQFQNPTRLRTLMKSDDEDATWVCYPSMYPLNTH